MKKIGIFGGTGKAGLATIETALKQGLEVTALVRDPSRMPETLRNHVKLVIGDVLIERDVDKVVHDCDGIIVTLGTGNSLGPTTTMSNGLHNILKAMRKNNVKPISVCMSAFVFYNEINVPARYQEVNADHRRMMNFLYQFDDLNWIALLPSHIGNYESRKYSVVIGFPPNISVSKYDVGHFLIECLTKPKYFKQQCSLAEEHRWGLNIEPRQYIN